MKHTLALSDVHLSQAHPEDPSDPMWMRYRRREHHPDDDFAAVIDHVLNERVAEGDSIELVFNGDIFDFDSPWVKDGTSSFDELPPTDAGCTEHMKGILADHETFFRAAAKLLVRGDRLTFLSGNHDIELYWPGVRKAIRDELARLAKEIDPKKDVDVTKQVRFRSWFHLTNDRIYFEHGSQYDIHNAVRHAALPLTKDGTRIHPVLGKLAFRRTGARMGYFNPYYEETFYMGLTGYLGHFAKAYMFSHRHIVRTWVKGALSTVFEIWRYRHADERIEEGRAAVRKELGAHITDEQIDKTHALRSTLAEQTMIPALRELWIDRVAITFAVLSITGLVALTTSSMIATGIVFGVMLAAFVLYEIFTPKPDVRTYDSAPEEVLSLFDIHGVRAICMGHTHRPFTRFIDKKGLYANSGAWCPAFEDQACTKPVLDGRPILWLRTDGKDTTSRPVYGGLYWWRNKSLLADGKNTKIELDGNSNPPASTRSGAGGVGAETTGEIVIVKGPKPVVQLDDQL